MNYRGQQSTPITAAQFDSNMRQITRVFNVVDYGAVPGGQDNTAAYSAAIADMLSKGDSGTLFFPIGQWFGQVKIPSRPLTQPATLHILGEVQPWPWFGTIGNFTLPSGGTILRSNATSGAVIECLPGPEYNNFSSWHVTVQNLEIRTYNNPQVHGIDMLCAQQMRLTNVAINTNRWSVQASEPTHNTAGIIAPGVNNGALTILDNVAVSGYFSGLVVGEHTTGNNLNVQCCYNALHFKVAQNHIIKFPAITLQRNRYNFKVEAACTFWVGAVSLEHANTVGQTDANNEWQLTQADLHDPNNLGRGEIRWGAVTGNVGYDPVFTTVGGTGIRTAQLGQLLS